MIAKGFFTFLTHFLPVAEEFLPRFHKTYPSIAFCVPKGRYFQTKFDVKQWLCGQGPVRCLPFLP